jgi:hypothetical protein
MFWWPVYFLFVTLFRCYKGSCGTFATRRRYWATVSVSVCMAQHDKWTKLKAVLWPSAGPLLRLFCSELNLFPFISNVVYVVKKNLVHRTRPSARLPPVTIYQRLYRLSVGFSRNSVRKFFIKKSCPENFSYVKSADRHNSLRCTNKFVPPCFPNLLTNFGKMRNRRPENNAVENLWVGWNQYTERHTLRMVVNIIILPYSLHISSGLDKIRYRKCPRYRCGESPSFSCE